MMWNVKYSNSARTGHRQAKSSRCFMQLFMELPTMLVPICNFVETSPQYRAPENACQPRRVVMTYAGFALVWREHKCMWLSKQKMFSIQKQSFFFISLFVSFFLFHYSFQYRRNSIRPSTQFIDFLQKIGRRDHHLFEAMHITVRGLRFVEVGISYPILGKVLFQISFTNYENILAYNATLVTSGNSGLSRLNSSRKSSDIPLPNQSPIG